MDNLTHTLVGIAISRAFFKHRTPYATTALIVAANVPDLDVLAAPTGIRYLLVHRGLTHSLLFLPVWVALIAWGLRAAARRWPGKARLLQMGAAAGEDNGFNQARAATAVPRVPSWRVALLLALAGVGSHLLLDLTNTYGIRLLWPLSHRWFAWDIENIFDPWIWVGLLGFLLLPMVLGLVGREVGVRRPSRYRLSATLALLLLVAWWGVRGFYHRRALDYLDGRLIEQQVPQAIAALPYVGDPFRWHSVGELSDRYVLATVDAAAERRDDAMPQQTLFKPEPTPALRLAESTATGRICLDFARFPWASVRESATGTTVAIADLRFKPADAAVRMEAEIVLDPQMQVRSERFSWQGERSTESP